MNKNRRIFSLFVILAFIQLSVLLFMVLRWEDVLTNGQQYRLPAEPVDPYDPFRGRYVDIRVRGNTEGPIAEGARLQSGQTAYVLLDKDAEGFARIHAVTDKRSAGSDYIQTKAGWIEDGNIVHFKLPFNRFYMREDLAPAAERAYRKQAGKNGVIAVRVKDGYGVIEGLYIGKQTIGEYLLSPETADEGAEE